jgi:hypothetical protein
MSKWMKVQDSLQPNVRRLGLGTTAPAWRGGAAALLNTPAGAAPRKRAHCLRQAFSGPTDKICSGCFRPSPAIGRRRILTSTAHSILPPAKKQTMETSEGHEYSTRDYLNQLAIRHVAAGGGSLSTATLLTLTADEIDGLYARIASLWENQRSAIRIS